jgi:hypothetical protein
MWFDAAEINDFTSITRAVTQGLAQVPFRGALNKAGHEIGESKCADRVSWSPTLFVSFLPGYVEASTEPEL